MSQGRTGKSPPSQGAGAAEAPRRHQAPTLPPLTTRGSEGGASGGAFVTR